MHTPTPASAHACTAPQQRKHKPLNYGRVVAGSGSDHLLAEQPKRPADELQQLRYLAQRIARLNPDSATIGAGMLASLVADARRALGQEGAAA